MANLKHIRRQMKSVRSIQQVTKAMKLVAAAKMRRAQERMAQARPYERRLTGVIRSLLPEVDRAQLPLLAVRPVERFAFVVVTSDRGLAGSFNTNAIRTAEEEIRALGRDRVDLFCIGRRGRDYFRKRGYSIVESHTDFWRDLAFHHALKIGHGITSHFTAGKADEIRVVYNEFKNVASQTIRVDKLLPLAYEEEGERGMERIYEPSKGALVTSLIPRHLNIEVWKYLLESYASEQAARMVAMDNATENAGDLMKSLKLEFNKARQASITKEMLEIVGGAEALQEK